MKPKVVIFICVLLHFSIFILH
ncbi:preprotein translocase subunit Sec61beta [candidate division WOR-3 bacterium]|nr:preprotein translocase subunit Sec61beta [candidate division WOR-3 bacterium]